MPDLKARFARVDAMQMPDGLWEEAETRSRRPQQPTGPEGSRPKVRTWRRPVTIAVALCVFGGAAAFAWVALRPLGDTPQVGFASQQSSSSSSVNTPSPGLAGVPVAVFDGTGTPGLAIDLQQRLDGLGTIEAQPPADWPARPIAKTTVYYRAGQDAPVNEEQAHFLAEQVLGGADVQVLKEEVAAGLVPPAAVLVVVIGTDYDSVAPPPGRP